MLALFRVVELILAVLLFVGVSVASDTSVTLSAEDNLPDWASKSTLQMELSTDSTNYAIIPLTEGLGLGGSEVERQVGASRVCMDLFLNQGRGTSIFPQRMIH